MEKYKFQAKNQDGLLEKALKELNTTEDNVLTKCASRFIPLTLLVAGNEIGRKQEKR